MRTDKGVCNKRGCNDIYGMYVAVPPGTNRSGGDSNFFLVSWIEAEHAFKFTVQGGHALCAHVNLTLVIRRVGFSVFFVYMWDVWMIHFFAYSRRE